MFGFRLYLMVGAAVGVVSLVGLWQWQTAQNRALRAENAMQAASITALRDQFEQARLAADVARAAAKREAERAEEYDQLREALLKGNDDAPLPDWFRDYLRNLGVVGMPLEPTDED